MRWRKENPPKPRHDAKSIHQSVRLVLPSHSTDLFTFDGSIFPDSKDIAEWDANDVENWVLHWAQGLEQEDRKDIADRLRQNRIRGRHLKAFVQLSDGQEMLALIFPERGLQADVRHAIRTELLGTNLQSGAYPNFNDLPGHVSAMETSQTSSHLIPTTPNLPSDEPTPLAMTTSVACVRLTRFDSFPHYKRSSVSLQHVQIYL